MTETIKPAGSPPGQVGHDHSVAVSIEDFEFKPPMLQAAVGQTIQWSNMDGEPHTVRATDGRFSSAIIVGEPFEWTVSGSPGTEVPYACSIHPAMTGLVTISGD